MDLPGGRTAVDGIVTNRSDCFPGISIFSLFPSRGIRLREGGGGRRGERVIQEAVRQKACCIM